MAESTVRRDENGYYCGHWQGIEIREVSVTTALGLLVDYSMVNPNHLKKAANFGRAVHDMIDMHERGRLDRTKLNNDLRKVLVQWLRCKAENGITVEQTEVVVVSIKYHYAGRLDVVAKIKGIKVIVELKSRAYNPITDPLQVEAYKQAYNEANPKDKALKTYFCGFDHKTGKYTFFEIKNRPGVTDFLTMFLTVLAVFKWKNNKIN